jgi:autotransporter-associated beta strand protein
MPSIALRQIALSSISILAIFASSGIANAACSATSAGNDTVTCDATAPATQTTPLNLQTGDDSLTVTGGALNGSVTGGTGTKTIQFEDGNIANYSNSGGISNMTMSPTSTATVTGDVTMGDNADSFTIGAGSVAGAVSQGAGIDSFTMTGGTIGSLQQGDGRDTFNMTGGTITGGFDDGDVASMSGGTIGRVNMKLDNNIFDMSGGKIIGNLVTGFGNDTITVSSGSIGGNISVSGGTDSVAITGGSVGGNVMMSTGQDSFTWFGGGTIAGSVDMGPDNDTATLRDLTAANLGNTTLITGGDGTDALVLGGSGLTSTVDAGLIRSFESWLKTDPGTWTVSGTITDAQTTTVQQGTLVLTGDNAAYAGQMNVDAAGTLEGRAQSLTPTINNSGLVRFAQPDTGTYAGLISGAGQVEKTGAGTTILATDQTYTGGTTIAAGTLQLGDAGTAGNILRDVTDNGTFAFNRSDVLRFDGTISGTGALSQLGSGTTVLTATNSYTGPTSVAAGTLAIGDAAHPGAALTGGGGVDVAGGATFGGYGTVAGDVANSGTLAVADAIPAFAGGGPGNFTINGH